MLNKTLRLFMAAGAAALLMNCQSGGDGSHAKVEMIGGNEVVTCNISEISDTIELKLSDVVSSCEMVQLETVDSSLFKATYHAAISENYIAIHSRGQMPIKLFNRKGKFVRNIGKIGRGPGEFRSLSDFQLDEKANRLYLAPFANANKLIVYSLDNEVVPYIPLAYGQSKFHAHVDGDVVTVLSMPFDQGDGKANPIAFQQTLGGKVIKECNEPAHLIVNPRNEKGQFVGFNNERSSTFNAGAFDSFTLKFGGTKPDTLYHYDTEQNKMIPVFAPTFTDEHHGTWSYEWKNHFWCWVFGDKYKGAKALVDKKTLKTSFFSIVNDFFGNIEMNRIYMSNHGMFICAVPAHELMARFKKQLEEGNLEPEVQTKIKGWLKNLKEDDNDVVFFGKMK